MIDNQIAFSYPTTREYATQLQLDMAPSRTARVIRTATACCLFVLMLGGSIAVFSNLHRHDRSTGTCSLNQLDRLQVEPPVALAVIVVAFRVDRAPDAPSRRAPATDSFQNISARASPSPSWT